jgi:hypothetical protein
MDCDIITDGGIGTVLATMVVLQLLLRSVAGIARWKSEPTEKSK